MVNLTYNVISSIFLYVLKCFFEDLSMNDKLLMSTDVPSNDWSSFGPNLSIKSLFYHYNLFCFHFKHIHIFVLLFNRILVDTNQVHKMFFFKTFYHWKLNNFDSYHHLNLLGDCNLIYDMRKLLQVIQLLLPMISFF